MKMKWIKIDADIFKNRKMKQLDSLPNGDTLQVIWFKLLCVAGTVNDGGLVYFAKGEPYTSETLAVQFDKPADVVKDALELFEKLKMTETSLSGVLKVRNWEKYQAPSAEEKNCQRHREYMREYMKKRRSDKKSKSHEQTEPDTGENDVSLTLSLRKLNSKTNVSLTDPLFCGFPENTPETVQNTEKKETENSKIDNKFCIIDDNNSQLLDKTLKNAEKPEKAIKEKNPSPSFSPLRENPPITPLREVNPFINRFPKKKNPPSNKGNPPQIVLTFANKNEREPEHFEQVVENPQEAASQVVNASSTNNYCPFQKIKDLYHGFCVSFPKIRAISGQREKAVAARWREYKSLDVFAEAFRAVERSSFLKGNNNRNWSADFDWIMRATNFPKILEGKYDDKGKAAADNKSDEVFERLGINAEDYIKRLTPKGEKR